MSFRSPITKQHNIGQDFDLFEKNHFSPFLSDETFSGFRPDHARIHYDNLPFDAFTNGADLDIQRNSYKTTANNSNDQSNSATFPKSFLTGLGYSPIKLSQGDYGNLPNDVLGRKFISPLKSNNITPIKMFPKSDRKLFQPFGSAERSLLHEVLSSQDFGEDFDGLSSFNWNNDQNKPVLRNVVNQPTYSSARNLNREAQDYNNEFDLKDKLKNIPGIQEKLKTQMVSDNKTVKRPSACKKDDFENLTKDIRAALRKSPKDTAVSTSQGETVSDNDDDEEDLEDFLTDMKGRGSKGLKILSIIVRNILLQRKEATYKEVAQIIYHECGDLFKNGRTLKDEVKDEKNIKRRVYDSLNILVSAGILLRDGKKVRCSENFLQGRILNKVEFKYKKDQLQNQLMQRKAVKENKLETLKDLIYKSLAIKNLIQRNKEKEKDPQFSNKKEETNSIEEEESPEEPSSVKFPFIVIVSPTPDNPIKANLDETQKELKIDSKDQLSILGDIDILQKLNLHKQVSKEFVSAQIPRGLLHYIPKEFFEMLK